MKNELAETRMRARLVMRCFDRTYCGRGRIGKQICELAIRWQKKQDVIRRDLLFAAVCDAAGMDGAATRRHAAPLFRSLAAQPSQARGRARDGSR